MKHQMDSCLDHKANNRLIKKNFQKHHLRVKKGITGGSRLSHTAVKLDSCLAQIFVAKFLCIIKLVIIIG